MENKGNKKIKSQTIHTKEREATINDRTHTFYTIFNWVYYDY